MRDGSGRALAVTVLLTILTACTGAATGGSQVSTPSATAADGLDATTSPFADTAEPAAVEPGTYRIPSSEWSSADYTVTLPEGWTVQYGHLFLKDSDNPDGFGFDAVDPDEIYADACEGSNGQLEEVGPGVDDLATALLQQAGPKARGPIATTLGGYPATRIDLAVPDGFDLKTCNVKDVGLQIWYSVPADKYFVLLPDGIMSVYIVDVDGQRQTFVTGPRGPATSDEDARELQAILDSIRIEP